MKQDDILNHDRTAVMATKTNNIHHSHLKTKPPATNCTSSTYDASEKSSWG